MWEQGDKGTGRQRRAMNINLSVDYDINDYCHFVEAFGKQMQTYVSIWQSQLYHHTYIAQCSGRHHMVKIRLFQPSTCRVRITLTSYGSQGCYFSRR